jgi:PhoPQ-activated pathogenicity-related protein
MRDSGKNFLHSGVLALSMLSATPAIGEVTALDRYVVAPDPSYRYELIETIPGDGYATHVLEMTSQRWRDEKEVDRPLWKHWLTIIEPEQVATGAALLIVGGGSNGRKPPARANPLLAMVAVTTRSVIADLRMVPNQPLTFVGESQQRSEDAIIAYSWDKYLRTGDETWPLRLPMTERGAGHGYGHRLLPQRCGRRDKCRQVHGRRSLEAGLDGVDRGGCRSARRRRGSGRD